MPGRGQAIRPTEIAPGLVVAIVGGGIGGLALALALGRVGVRSVVFEKDGSFGARSQGYGLTMQQGMRTIRRLGIGDAVAVRTGVGAAVLGARFMLQA